MNFVNRKFQPPRAVEPAIEQIWRVGAAALGELIGPNPIDRNRVTPSASAASKPEAVWKSVSTSWVGSMMRRERVRRRKSAVLSFSVIVPAASEACFRRADTR